MRTLADFKAVGYPLTFSVLPQLDDSRQLARAGAAAGCEVMLHLPMEPTGSESNPGPGCVMVDMTDREISALVAADLATVPGAVGVNNHMGSRATANRRVMAAALSTLRHQGLFFVDSLTTGASVADDVAGEAGVPYAQRSVFLDTNFAGDIGSVEQFLEAAQERVQQLGTIAQRRGAAIGICHYHPRTAEMLARLLPALEESGVRVVSISDLVGSMPRTGRSERAPAAGSGRGANTGPGAGAERNR